MKKQSYFWVAFITFSMHAMDDEFEANAQLSGCETSCEALFQRDKPLFATNKASIQLKIALKERKTCYQDCFERYRAQVIMLHAKMLQSKE